MASRVSDATEPRGGSPRSIRRACSTTCSPSRTRSATRSGAPTPPACRGAPMPGGLVVCGMGGSAIGGDLARAAIGGRAQRPLRVVRGYDLVPWMAGDALVLCASLLGQHRGDAVLLRRARASSARRASSLTTGGELAELRARGRRSRDRRAVRHAAAGRGRLHGGRALQCAAAAGVCDSLRGEVEAAGAARRAARVGAGRARRLAAKSLAPRSTGRSRSSTAPGRPAAVASRWKTQVNENAKQPAFSRVLPEANHNEVSAGSPFSPGAQIELDLLQAFCTNPDFRSLDPCTGNEVRALDRHYPDRRLIGDVLVGLTPLGQALTGMYPRAARARAWARARSSRVRDSWK